MCDNQRPWLIMLSCYFGQWPPWMNFFIESCKWNPDVQWRIYTDCDEPENRADNVTIVPISFADYKALARERLGIPFDPAQPYKLCDLRPSFGILHEQEIAGYPFFGYGDIDVIYGNIAVFYGALRADFDVLSTHPERASGHFLVLRNTRALRHAFESIPDYRALLAQPQHTGADEGAFTEVLRAVAGRSRIIRRALQHGSQCA